MQKYRLYLKRLSAVANQQACMVAALRGRDFSYLPMGSLNGYANFSSLAGSRPLPGCTSFQTNGALPRMNTFTGSGVHGFAPSVTAQLGRNLNNTSNSISEVRKLPVIGLQSMQGNQQRTLIQGISAPLNLDKLQQPKVMQEASNHFLGDLSRSGVATGQPVNSFNSAAKNSQILQPNQQQSDTQSAGLSNQQSVRRQPLSTDPFDIGVGGSHSVDLGRCNKTLQGAIPSTAYSGNTLPVGLRYNHNDLFSGNFGDNTSPMVSQLGSSVHDDSSSSVAMSPLADPVIGNDRPANVQNHASPFLTTMGINGDANLSNFDSLGNSSHKWEDPSQGRVQNSNLMYNSLSGFSVSGIPINDQSAGNQEFGNAFYRLNMPNISQTSFGAPMLPHDSRSDKAAADGQLHYKDEPLFDDMKFPGVSSGAFSFVDLVADFVVKPVKLFSSPCMNLLHASFLLNICLML